MSGASEAYWAAECDVCVWQQYRAVSHQANRLADMHTKYTGHRTTVRDRWQAIENHAAPEQELADDYERNDHR